MAAPDTEGMLSQQDAMFIPGIGPAGMHEPDIRITSDADGLTVQRADAERVRFNAAAASTILSAGNHHHGRRPCYDSRHHHGQRLR